MTDPDPLAVVERDSPGPARASVVWLHGLGADGHDFESMVDTLELPPELPVRFVFPHAPYRAVTVNAGMPMRAWYDVRSRRFTDDEDAEGIAESAAQVGALLAAERERGIGPASVILGGFSQGGAIALHAALRYPERLAGAMALSSYLPLSESLEAQAGAANAGLAVFMGHGRHDPVIPCDYGRVSAQRLRRAGYDVDWHEYEIDHGVGAEELADMRCWLVDHLRGARVD